MDTKRVPPRPPALKPGDYITIQGEERGRVDWRLASITIDQQYAIVRRRGEKRMVPVARLEVVRAS